MASLGAIFGRLLNSIVTKAGDMGKKLAIFPIGHLAAVFRVSQDVKGKEFKNLMEGTKAPAEEKEAFYKQVPQFTEYVSNVYKRGRNRELIAKKKPIAVPAKKAPEKVVAPKPEKKKKEKPKMAG